MIFSTVCEAAMKNYKGCKSSKNPQNCFEELQWEIVQKLKAFGYEGPWPFYKVQQTVSEVCLTAMRSENSESTCCLLRYYHLSNLAIMADFYL